MPYTFESPIRRPLAALAKSALVLACLGLPTLAQSPIDPKFVIPSNGPVPDYEDLAFGNVFGNEEPVLVSINSGEIELRADPKIVQSATVVPNTLGVTSVAVWKDQPGELEALYCSNGQGLHRILGDTEWGVASETFVLGDPLWKNATAMNCVDVVSAISTQQYVMGISADKRHVIGSFDLGGGFYTVAIDILETRQILDYAVVDHDGDGDSEIAILTTLKLFIHEPDGTVVTSYPSTGGLTGKLAVVQDSGGERLAWATKDSSGNPVLEVLNSAGQDPQVALSFPIQPTGAAQDLDVSGMAAGDMDEDGDLDLVITDFATQRATYLDNTTGDPGSTQAFSAAAYELLHPETGNAAASGAANDVRPIVRDITNDGAVDVVVALNAESSIEVYELTPVVRPFFISSAQHLDASGSSWDEDSGTLSVNVALNLPQELQAWDGVQVTLWEQVTEGGSIEAAGIDNDVFEFSTTSAFQWFDVVTDHVVSSPSAPDFGTKQYWIRYRFVDFTTSPFTITAATPGFVMGLEFGNQDYMMMIQPGAPNDIDAKSSQPSTADDGNNDGGYLYTNITPPNFDGGAQPPPVGGLVIVGAWM